MAVGVPAYESRRLIWWLGVGVVLVTAIIVRLPILTSSDFFLTADEASNALAVKRLVEHGELRLYTWDSSYQGMVEGFISVPFALLMDFRPLAFKLTALFEFLVLIVAVIVLGRRLGGRAVGLLSGALLVAFSPRVVHWSLFAAGGLGLTIAWGTISLLAWESLVEQPKLSRFFGFGVLLGFGLYIWELFFFYIALLAIAGLAAVGWWRSLGTSEVSKLRSRLYHAAALAAGICLGWSPKLVAWLRSEGLGKTPSFSLAPIGRTWHLLTREALPDFFGLAPGPRPATSSLWYTGWGAAFLLVCAAAWLLAAYRRRGELLTAARLRQIQLDGLTLLVLLVPLIGLAFLSMAVPQGVYRNRYLLPLLSSLPILIALMVVGLWHRSRVAGILLGLVVIGLPLGGLLVSYRAVRLLDKDLRLITKHEPLHDVIDFLDAKRIRGGYADYFSAYKTTLLSGERLIFAPVMGFDRYPSYMEDLASFEETALILRTDPHPQRLETRDFFHRLFRSAGLDYDVTAFGRPGRRPFYEVYTVRGGGRIIAPPPADRSAPALLHPRARIRLASKTPDLSVGERARLRLVVKNRGAQPWSSLGERRLAPGLQPGSGRVEAAYRWLDANGERLLSRVAVPLPHDVAPGARAKLRMEIEAPLLPGIYQLCLTLVQLPGNWFDEATGSALILPLRVRPPRSK